jgi:hypothetical protein
MHGEVVEVTNSVEVIVDHTGGVELPGVVVGLAQRSSKGSNDRVTLSLPPVYRSTRSGRARVGSGRAVSESVSRSQRELIDIVGNDSASSSPSERAIVLGAAKAGSKGDFEARRDVPAGKISDKKVGRADPNASDSIVNDPVSPRVTILLKTVVSISARAPSGVRQHILNPNFSGRTVTIRADAACKTKVRVGVEELPKPFVGRLSHLTVVPNVTYAVFILPAKPASLLLTKPATGEESVV